MPNIPNVWDNEEYVSCLLSDVMEEIGVNKEMVMKRRRTWLLIETFRSLINKCDDCNDEVYIFGSQTEGTTTLGLASDTDCLLLLKAFNIIQKFSEWQPGSVNLLMFQDDKTSAGHCLLQVLRPDVPLPAETPITNLDDKYQHRYTGGKIFLKNSAIEKYCLCNLPRSGPSFVHKIEGRRGLDTIIAFSCNSMPRSVKRGLKKNYRQGTMSEDMMKYVESKGCFVVGTGRNGSVNKELEWRISTSHAERCAMFSLKITQIQCYILMKMICNTYLKHSHDKCISTFMCKNVFLQTVGKTSITEWNKKTLLKCLKNCLIELKDSIKQAHCPHFIVHGNNIMQGKFSSKTRKWLYGILQNIIRGNDLGLLRVEIDMLGRRLSDRLNNDKNVPSVDINFLGNVSLAISGELLLNCVNWIIPGYLSLALFSNNFDRILKTLESIYQQGSKEERTACCLLKPFIASSLGCELASVAIQAHCPLSPQVLELLNIGANLDVASGRLKQASVFYCLGEIRRAELILRETEEIYNRNGVSAVCGLPTIVSHLLKTYSYMLNEGAIKHVVAFGVTFRRSEIHCLPKELQYEMFRCIPEDPSNRFSIELVDSLPYLYFLQYKTYCRLQRWEDQQQALTNLEKSIDLKTTIGHQETALNLLGQCMEYGK